MTSGIDELEALLAALRLSFLTSTSATSSSDDLRQSIAAFRVALRPDQSVVVVSPSPTEVPAESQLAQLRPPVLTLIESTWQVPSASRHDINLICIQVSQLAQQIDLVITEGTNHIRELIQIIEELKAEVRDLRSATVALKPPATSEDRLPPPRPIGDSAESWAISIHEAQVDHLPSGQHALGGSGSPSLSTPTPQAITAATANGSIPGSVISFRPFSPFETPSLHVIPKLVCGETSMAPPPSRSLCAVEVPKLPNFPPALSWVSPSAFYPVAIPTPAQTINTTLVNLLGSPRQPSPPPPPVNRPEPTPSATESPKSVLSDIKAEGFECTTCVLRDGGEMEAEDFGGSENPVRTELRSKSPIIAKAVGWFAGTSDEEMRVNQGDKVVILDHPDTPIGWMYGEIAETRRGVFPARYVELLRPVVEETLNNDHISENSEIAQPGSESPVTAKGLRHFSPMSAGELSFSPGDTIKVLDFPDTAVGWMYGEIVKTRRGIFPAWYVMLENE
ncbi:hypothetical protein FRC04_011219 [Tulasnella sp. 424]|nr:hypothetical protein FRC04_011219 [Tulasnella sp. 424]